MLPRKPAARRLQVTQLEDRVTPSTFTWDDGGGSNNWSEGNNWVGNVAPTAADVNTIIVFNTADATTIMDIVGMDVAEIRFDAGSTITLTLNTPLILDGAGATFNIQDSTGNNSILGSSITLMNAAAFIDCNAAAGALTISSDLTGSQGLTKLGTGQLTLSTAGANTYAGTTTIVAGTLLLNTNTADKGLSGTVVVGDGAGAADSAVLQLGATNFEIPDTATLTIASDGRVNVPAGRIEDVTTLAVNGGQMNIAATGIFEIQPGGTVTSTGAAGSVIDGTGNLRSQSTSITFNISNGAGATDLRVTTPLTEVGAANLVKTGAGTLEFNMQSANALTGTTAINDGVLLLNTNTTDAGLAGIITVGDNAGAANSAILRLVNTFEIFDGATINVNADGLVDVTATGVEDVTILNMGSATGGGNVAVAAGGTFRMRPAGAVNSIASPTSSTISGPGTFSLLGTTTFTVASGAAAQDLVVSAVITGAGLGVTKAGAGRLTLNADNTYTGTTTVTAGELEVNGSQGGSAVSVSGGTIGGTGTVGAITTTGGAVAPGLLAAPATLHSGNVNLAGASFSPVITGGAADQLTVTGTVTLTGATLNVTLTWMVPAGSSFVVIANDGTDAVVGTFTGLPEGSPVTAGGQQFALSYVGGTGNDVVLSLPTGSKNLLASGSANGQTQLFTPNAAGAYAAGATFTPFPGNTTALRTAVADVNGDGTEDTIFVTGPGSALLVTVISGADNTTVLVAPFDPFGSPTFTGGGFLSAGDIDGDGRAEYVVTPDQGGGPRVTIFSLVGAVNTQRANFFGIDDDSFRGGARSAIGDVNKDGTPDMVVCAGFLGGPRTALFNGTTLFGTPTRLIGDFFAFPGDDAVTLRNGVFVASGDVDGDGFADLIFGGGPGGAPRAFILSGAKVSANDVAGAQASPIGNFFVAGNSSDRGGVRLAAKNADGDAKADVVVGSGEGSPANARVYLGKNFAGAAEPATFQDINLFGGGNLPGGVFVG